MGAGEDMVRYVCGGRRRHGEVCMWGAGEDMVRYVCGGGKMSGRQARRWRRAEPPLCLTGLIPELICHRVKYGGRFCWLKCLAGPRLSSVLHLWATCCSQNGLL